MIPVAWRDRDDTAFIHLAVVGGADFLVSSDNDLASLRCDAQVAVLSAVDKHHRDRL